MPRCSYKALLWISNHYIIEQQYKQKKRRLEEIDILMVEHQEKIDSLNDEKHSMFLQLKKLLVMEEEIKQEKLRLEEQKRYVSL